jgi:hypothetical protein
MKHLLMCQIKSYENIWHTGAPNKENTDSTIMLKWSVIVCQTRETMLDSV